MDRVSRRALLALALGAPLGCDARPPRAGRIHSGRSSVRAEAPAPAKGPFAFDEELFERKRTPERGDWLGEHAEVYQSYEAYVASDPVRPTSSRSRIVLQPLGPFSARGKELLAAVREHATIFFSLEVSTAPAIALPRTGRRKRRTWEGSFEQHHTGTILKALEDRIPSDAVAYLGVTEADLYPKASWNFVFGQATLTERVGTYSLARFLPPFEAATTPGDFARAVRRSVQLLSHETGHVFSLPHCVRYECVMNGSNSLNETDRKPVELCPDCLRKLAYTLEFDPVARYRALAAFFTRFGLTVEADWLVRRLARLSSGNTAGGTLSR
jgi:archaemetzincin